MLQTAEPLNASARTPVRCQTEHRHRRLLHLLDREESKTPRHSLGVVQSLPALPDAPILNANAPSPKKLASAAFLSPLKSTKRSNDAERRKVQFHDLREGPSNNTEAHTEPVSNNMQQQQQPQQRGVSFNYLAAPQKESTPSSVVLVNTQRVSHGSYPDSVSLQQQLAKETAQCECTWLFRSKKADELEQQHAKEKAIEVKSFQFEQMRLKQQKKKERKIDEQMLVEQMDWERAQLAIVDQDHREYLVWKRSHVRAAYLQTMEVQRRQQTVTTISKNFFDKFAVLPAPQAIEEFLAKREQLLKCCMHQFRDHVASNELEAIQTEIKEMLEKEHDDLKYRVKRHQREEFVIAEKRRAISNLQKSHVDQIQEHVHSAKARQAEDAATRQDIIRDQDALDRRFQAREANRKQQTLAHNAKILEQIRNNEDAHASLSISIQGASPLYRTPWWSDESGERSKIYDKPIPEKSNLEHHIIHGKKTCRWYD